jgi:hypothetical protein
LLLSIRAPGGHVKTKGTIYLSNIRMVFVANKHVGNFFAFDMPLVSNTILKVGSSFMLLYSFNRMQGRTHKIKRSRKKKKNGMATKLLPDHDTTITCNQHKSSTHVLC